MTDKRKLNIFVAEPVPLKNKGEQAIVMGIKDLFSEDYDVNISVLDWCSKATTQNGIKSYPAKYYYDILGSEDTGWKIKQRILSYFFRRLLSLNTNQSRLVERGYSEGAYQAFVESDLVLVGHDGIFGLEQEAVIALAKRMGKTTGILGCGLYPMRRHRWLYWTVYKRAIINSDFCFFREIQSYEYMREVFNHTKIKLAPDPAFFMKASSESLDLFTNDDLRIVVTVCEKSVIYDGAFLNLNGKAKREYHRNLLTEVLDFVGRKFNAKIYFLPHSIEEGIGNDVEISIDISKRMQHENTVVIDNDLSGAELKGLIADSDFLIAERTHSMIGAVSVATPFIGLTSSADTRTHDIIGDMCEYSQGLVDLDFMTTEKLCGKIEDFLINKELHAKSLEKVSLQLNKDLVQVKDEIVKNLNNGS